ncbi:MAG: hypothetical protein O3A92_04685 [Verrucomicrobia bacterium]|nr:hypothetical protein [Verrucomicrobiota bacterium]
MSTNTKESALEACIERYLTGGVSVMPSPGHSLSDDVGVYQTTKGVGYLRGKSTDFKTEFANDRGQSSRIHMRKQCHCGNLDRISARLQADDGGCQNE